MSYSDCSIPEFFDIQEPVAMKAYGCCECSAPIKKWERYVKCTGKWEGDFNFYRQHILCANTCRYIRDHAEGDCIGFGTLREYYCNELRGNQGMAKFLPHVHDLRTMMAQIIRRERSGHKEDGEGA